MKRAVLFLGLSALLHFSGSAQQYMGVATGNYSGLSSLYLNPANIADNHERIVIDLFGINAGVDNSLGKINTSGINKFVNGSDVSVNDVFTYSNSSTFNLMAPYAEVRGPGILIGISRKHSIALTTRIRGINQFNNFDRTLYRTVTDSTYTNSGNIDLTAQNFNWTAHLWAEAALTYGAVVLERGRSELKAGITLRYLGGIGYLGLKGHNMDIHFASGQDSLYARNTDIEYASNVVNSTGALGNGLSNNNIFNQFFGSKSGNGLSVDAGIIYDYLEPGAAKTYDMDGKTGIPDPAVNRYKLRLSASVADLGYINYNGDNNYVANVKGNGTLTGSGIINNVKDFSDFTAYAKSQGFSADTGKTATRLYMPAAMLLSADYHAWRHVYVNATYLANLANRQDYGNSFYNRLTVTPRYDTRLFSIAVPVGYSALANDMKVGLGIRVSGFYIGTDDMLVLFGSKQYGVNMYAGAFVPLYRHIPKDRDGDHVSDKKDWCPDDMGTWEHHGCPLGSDKDEDRQKQEEQTDSTRDCPFAAGLAAPQDNKDADGDGIPDAEDACPNVAGVASNHGCPETGVPAKATTDLRAATLLWEKGQKHITREDALVLDRFVHLLKEYPGKKLVISSFTYTKCLQTVAGTSASHAQTVARYLMEQGIKPEQLDERNISSQQKLDNTGKHKSWLTLELK